MFLKRQKLFSRYLVAENVTLRQHGTREHRVWHSTINTIINMVWHSTINTIINMVWHSTINTIITMVWHSTINMIITVVWHSTINIIITVVCGTSSNCIIALWSWITLSCYVIICSRNSSVSITAILYFGRRRNRGSIRSRRHIHLRGLQF